MAMGCDWRMGITAVEPPVKLQKPYQRLNSRLRFTDLVKLYDNMSRCSFVNQGPMYHTSTRWGQRGTNWTRSVTKGPVTLWNSRFCHMTLQWRHNGRDGVSNHQPQHCLLNRLFGRRSKKTSKLRVTGLSAGNSPVTGDFPTQTASSAENVSIWWRHHDRSCYGDVQPVSLGTWCCWE